jgi:predicted O-linked N-acetylglucosamine transferase (SPINDLY family)
VCESDLDALFAEALAHHNRGRLIEALIFYDAIVRQNGDFAPVHANRGAALCGLNRFDEALASFDSAIALSPDYAGAHNNRANVLSALKRWNAALAGYDRAIALDPNYAEAHYNRANALKAMKRPEDAVRSYDRAIALRPGHAEAYANRGNTFKDLNRWEEARASYEAALALRPDIAFVPGALLYAKTRLCDFSGLDGKIAALEQGIRDGRKVCTPFQVLAISGSAALQRRAAELYAETVEAERTALPALPKYARHGKIRLGYFSADFHDHATMHLMAELFERHDRSRFEAIAFSFGPERTDALRARACAAFDRFIDVRARTDRDVALLARALEIDIAVDLKGFTQDDRAGIFALRAAPIQASYLGYPGTMGADWIDYIIADRIVVPAGSEAHYREKIVRLPHSYQVNDCSRAISPRAFTRAELGLPEAGFVFACFNNGYKITPLMFDCWMRLLRDCDGSVLWLLEDNAMAARNLKSEAAARGIAPERLIFAPRMQAALHLARLRLADLFLDTLPYNAHTTASEALWAGLPVLTSMGETFAGRVAASLLHAVGLSEMATTSLPEYEARAREFAQHPERLAAIRQMLAANRLTTPLFDAGQFARHIEAAYTAMYARHRAGFAPTDIDVPSG